MALGEAGRSTRSNSPSAFGDIALSLPCISLLLLPAHSSDHRVEFIRRGIVQGQLF
jgi:hypothetical protein